MAKYIVTGYVKAKGRRDAITTPSTKAAAQKRKASLQKELKDAIPKHKWLKDLQVEEV